MIQKLLFDYKSVSRGKRREEGVKALFFRGDLEEAGGGLAVKGGCALSFDTYFNMFSALKWKEYTTLNDIGIKLSLKGKGKILVLGANLSEPDKEIVLKEEAYSCGKREEAEPFRAKLSEVPDFLYFRIEAKEDTMLYSGRYEGTLVRSDRVRIAVGICTYKREKELEENIRKIKEQIFEDASSPLHECLDVYIADNGQTLKGIPFFTDAAKAHNDKLFIFENKNRGGSAGFTRCMIEAVLKKDAGYTHMLLLDDDAEIEPFVLERTRELLSALKEEYRDKFVGGACISFDERIIQGPNGSCIIKDKEKIYAKEYKIGYDLSIKRFVILNERKEPANYNRWTFCCIPVKYITKNNLPLPLFLHCDDSEYALRCGSVNNNFIVSMNGICVWHLDDSHKQHEYIFYYDSRNNLILRDEFFHDFTTSYELKKIKITVANAVSFRYNIYDIWGVLDFYKGIDAFKKLNVEALNTKLRKSGYDGTARFKAGEEEIKRLLSPSRYGHLARVTRKLLTWALPAVRGRAYYDKDCPGDGVDYFLRKELVFVDRETGDAVLIKKSYRNLFKVLSQYLNARKLKTRHDSVWKEWHERIGELQTLDFWERYLEIK